MLLEVMHPIIIKCFPRQSSVENVQINVITGETEADCFVDLQLRESPTIWQDIMGTRQFMFRVEFTGLYKLFIRRMLY